MRTARTVPGATRADKPATGANKKLVLVCVLPSALSTLKSINSSTSGSAEANPIRP